MDIKQFKNKVIHASPVIIVLLLIFLPPVGVAVVWSENTICSKRSKYALTCFATVFWMLIVAVSMSHMSVIDFFKSNRNNDIIVFGGLKDTESSDPQKDDGVSSEFEVDTTTQEYTYANNDSDSNDDPPETALQSDRNNEKDIDTVEPNSNISSGDVPSTNYDASVPNDTSVNDELVITDCTYIVHKNQKASVTIKGKPNTEYICRVKYQSGYSNAKGTGALISDSEGYVTWTWKIGSQTSTSFKPIITITGNGQTITAEITVVE